MFIYTRRKKQPQGTCTAVLPLSALSPSPFLLLTGPPLATGVGAPDPALAINLPSSPWPLWLVQGVNM